MKTLFFYSCILFLGIISCSDGQDGLDGAMGEQGPPGADGNANVIQYEFGEHTFTNLLNLEIAVSKEFVDSSLILVYYNPVPESETAWYPVPGIGPSNIYQTRYLIYQISTEPSIYRLAIRTLLPDGSGPYGNPVTFRKIRVIFAEATIIYSGINLQDFNAVADYLDLGI